LIGESRAHGNAGRENPDQKRARVAVSNAIKRAIDALNKHSHPLAEHLNAYVQTGFFLSYRRSGIVWDA
jgi:hypothetical protein